jgi:hypothetical protein
LAVTPWRGAIAIPRHPAYSLVQREIRLLLG